MITSASSKSKNLLASPSTRKSSQFFASSSVNVSAGIASPKGFPASVNEGSGHGHKHASHHDTVSGAPSSQSTEY